MRKSSEASGLGGKSQPVVRGGCLPKVMHFQKILMLL